MPCSFAAFYTRSHSYRMCFQPLLQDMRYAIHMLSRSAGSRHNVARLNPSLPFATCARWIRGLSFCTFLPLSPTGTTKSGWLDTVGNCSNLANKHAQTTNLIPISLGSKEQENRRRADLKRPASAVQFRP